MDLVSKEHKCYVCYWDYQILVLTLILADSSWARL